MNILDVLGQLDGDKIKYQVLSSSIVSSKEVRGSTDITFATDFMNTSEVMSGSGKNAIIVWLNPGDYEEALSKAKSRGKS